MNIRQQNVPSDDHPINLLQKLARLKTLHDCDGQAVKLSHLWHTIKSISDVTRTKFNNCKLENHFSSTIKMMKSCDIWILNEWDCCHNYWSLKIKLLQLLLDENYVTWKPTGWSTAHVTTNTQSEISTTQKPNQIHRTSGLANHRMKGCWTSVECKMSNKSEGEELLWWIIAI